MSKTEVAETTVPDTEKKPWIPPAATVEQVNEATLAGASPINDGLACST